LTRIAICIPTYNGVDRCRYMLETLMRNDPDAQSVPIFVVEDLFGREEDPEKRKEVSDGYDALEMDYPVEVFHSDTWRNMHGNAKYAFEIAQRECNPDWIVYLGDDLAITPGSLSNMLHFLRENDLPTVGAVQFPYWNADDIAFSTSSHPDLDDVGVFWSRDRDFYATYDWTRRVKLNPHWQGVWREHTEEPMPGVAVPYVNVNGVGFAVHVPTYNECGGFAEGTWCLDESLSYNVWTRSNRGVVCLPGPPLVHYFGASTMAKPVQHDMHTEQRWIEAIGHNKADSDKIMRAKMGERKDAIIAETRKASYWNSTLSVR
jgi:GT2 family glycosyltransferase